MPVNRAFWAPSFRKLPPWACPTCERGQLASANNDVLTRETGPSLRDHSHEEWDPDWVRERLAGFLTCNDPTCGDVFAISGTSGVTYYTDEDIYGQVSQAIENELERKHVFPTPHMFQISGKCPDDVRALLISGFEIFWSDHDSCANKFRMAVEVLLKERKIATYTKPKKGTKRRPLTLHARIDLFRKKDSDIGACLEAIKWLGNYGSHSNTGLSRDHVFDAADMLEHVVNNLYDKVPSPLLKANKINKKKRPV